MLLLPASVTVVEANDTRRLLLQAMQTEASDVVTVDASNLKRFDSSALAVLIECHRAADERGKTFAMKQPPTQLAALAKLYGVEALLGTADVPPAGSDAFLQPAA